MPKLFTPGWATIIDRSAWAQAPISRPEPNCRPLHETCTALRPVEGSIGEVVVRFEARLISDPLLTYKVGSNCPVKSCSGGSTAAEMVEAKRKIVGSRR